MRDGVLVIRTGVPLDDPQGQVPSNRFDWHFIFPGFCVLSLRSSHALPHNFPSCATGGYNVSTHDFLPTQDRCSDIWYGTSVSTMKATHKLT
jgi:hypothetical protein